MVVSRSPDRDTCPTEGLRRMTRSSTARVRAATAGGVVGRPGHNGERPCHNRGGLVGRPGHNGRETKLVVSRSPDRDTAPFKRRSRGDTSVADREGRKLLQAAPAPAQTAPPPFGQQNPFSPCSRPPFSPRRIHLYTLNPQPSTLNSQPSSPHCPLLHAGTEKRVDAAGWLDCLILAPRPHPARQDGQSDCQARGDELRPASHLPHQRHKAAGVELRQSN